ncbi:lectin-like protein [Draconibacterium halophilum]|uniref:C-type lectin domain-containing protein n=1 Tax=Draconibacterium halophilum TaxID=2706887 RepID=A0A6C0RA34_9BACT|nr:lectin-like protein [Draconibacterium halophilum]QIA07254.1 hypothetical protein G0Q07_05730 [Draconibacterium halophilum]
MKKNLLLFCIISLSLSLQAQTLTISLGGQTGTSGTNWTSSGSDPVTIETTSGDAVISPSVIENLLNAGSSVVVLSSLDIRLSDAITKTGGGAALLEFRAGRDLFIQADITSSNSALNLKLDSDNDGDNIGAITNSSSLTTNSGFINFLDDVSFNGTSAQTINSGAQYIICGGEVMLSNNNGVTFQTADNNVTFSGAVNSGNSYSLDATSRTWNAAHSLYNSDSDYLATITSKMELTAAMAVVPSGGAWLGGSDKDTEGTWKWVTGPEAGTVFWTTALSQGIKGYVGTNGHYVNWNTGEPNDSGGDEDALQIRNNTDGYWNDLPTTVNDLASVVEHELSPSPLIVDAGDGNVIFQNSVGAGKVLKSVDITAANTIINGGGITTESESSEGQLFSGNLIIGGAEVVLEMLNTSSSFILNSGKTITNSNTGESTLTIKNPNNIQFISSNSVSSADYPFNLVLWADTDGDGAGNISIGTNGSISTNEGHLWMGGGSGSTTWNNLTVGDGYATGITGTGILLDDVTINADAGDISISGKSTSTNAASHGIHLKYTGSSTLTTNSGTITLQGVGGQSTAAEAANCDGIRIEGTLQTTSGTIDLTGLSTAEDQSEGIAIESTGSLASTSGNILLQADNIYFSGDARAASAGELALSPVTSTATIGIAGATGTLSLPSSRFTSNFTDGFSLITIGNGAQSGNINLNTVSFRDNMRLQTSGTVIIDAAQTVTTENIKLQIDNNLDMGTGSKIIR